jgi:hypothetical protein
MSWKNPAVTLTFLVLVNLAYLVFKSLHVSLLSSFAHKLFVLTLVMIVKQNLFGINKE